jgi:hypothetical protein
VSLYAAQAVLKLVILLPPPSPGITGMYNHARLLEILIGDDLHLWINLKNIVIFKYCLLIRVHLDLQFLSIIFYNF